MFSREVLSIVISTIAFITPAVAKDSSKVIVGVGGRIMPSCSVDAATVTDLNISLAAGGSEEVRFDVDCNIPISVTLNSVKGAIALDTDKVPSHSADYTDSVDYTAGFDIPIGGSSWSVSGQTGAALRGGKVFSPTSAAQKNKPPFKSSLRLALAWDAPVKKLLAGSYSETITITVTGQD